MIKPHITYHKGLWYCRTTRSNSIKVKGGLTPREALELWACHFSVYWRLNE